MRLCAVLAVGIVAMGCEREAPKGAAPATWDGAKAPAAATGATGSTTAGTKPAGVEPAPAGTGATGETGPTGAATGPAGALAPTGAGSATGATGSTGAPAPTGAAAATGPIKSWQTDSGLIIEDLKLGDGAEAGRYDHVKVHYQGSLGDGREFANSRTTNEPLTANLAGGVIKGWQEGIPGMKVGGKRRLIVPPELGYGKRGSGQNIPPDALLVFEIELLEIVK